MRFMNLINLLSYKKNNRMIIDDWKIEKKNNFWRISFCIKVKEELNIVFFEVSVPELFDDNKLKCDFPLGDIAINSTLIPAMKLAVPIVNLPEVSEPQVMERIEKAQKLLSDWFEGLSKIHINQFRSNYPIHEFNSIIENEIIGLFFSGGVDSWHTLTENQANISALIAVHGFDIPVKSVETWHKVEKELIYLSKSLNLPLFIIKTNLREFSDKYIDWPTYHGSALGTVAAILSPYLTKTLISSSFDEKHLFPYGSHPELDYLWSGYRHEVNHYGCHLNRVNKIKIIAKNRLVKETLRVCWVLPDSYNCSNCRKCTLTMLALDLIDELSDVITFKENDLLELIEKHADFNDKAAKIYFNELIAGYTVKSPSGDILKKLLSKKASSDSTRKCYA